MSDPKVLTCPTCGAQLNISGDEPQVKCGYCGNTVIVPEELRVKQPDVMRVEMPQPQVVVQGPGALPGTPVGFYSPPRSSSAFAFLGCLFPILLTAAIFAFAYFMLPTSAKQFFSSMIQSATGPGFARQVSSFGGDGTGAGLFQDARHIAADGKGNVYVSDYNSLRVPLS